MLIPVFDCPMADVVVVLRRLCGVKHRYGAFTILLSKQELGGGQ
jgi:hypothetical protein